MRTLACLTGVTLGLALSSLRTDVVLAVENGQRSPESQPAPLFAPYVDTSLWPTFDLVAAAKTQGIRHFTLAFVTSNRGEPCWGGYATYVIGKRGKFDERLIAQIKTVRRLGADVTVSFGGAMGTELAMAHKDFAALAKVYQRVIDAYELRRIDFDVEGAAVKDPVSIARRARAIALLQETATKNNTRLDVWLTLPVLPTGLTDEGVRVVTLSVQHGVRISGVNIMAMNYGSGAAPNPKRRMGEYAVQAATSLHRQLTRLMPGKRSDSEIWQMIGVTPMIGVNDIKTEVFDQQATKELRAFAVDKKMGLLSMWSLNRDRADARRPRTSASAKSSGVRQAPFEFTDIFGGFKARR